MSFSKDNDIQREAKMQLLHLVIFVSEIAPIFLEFFIWKDWQSSCSLVQNS